MNSLQDYVVASPTINTFKARLDKFWKNQDSNDNDNDKRAWNGWGLQQRPTSPITKDTIHQK